MITGFVLQPRQLGRGENCVAIHWFVLQSRRLWDCIARESSVLQ